MSLIKLFKSFFEIRVGAGMFRRLIVKNSFDLLNVSVNSDLLKFVLAIITLLLGYLYNSFNISI